ncbi:alpha/beta fold hydrolase [Deinococcus radiophilus]|uniref:Alpha/beta fold hydrolase n=1 Tax=Deinococcus radiophilus TaxID=32062 RepID=A0A431VQ59_9DEIO|nr:alpha/beta fold hydrolase [Deinococcus radiophilus]RTR25331.1 alpha/beta fold hydrolase [Deinococcus radiophilus]UFA50473.1 alpha/beta hydrolase [Deinococcus radiophilus]
MSAALRRCWPALVLVASLGTGLAVPYLFRPPLIIGQDAVSGPASRDAAVTLEQSPVPFIHIRPARQEAKTLLIFYPGGLVRPQAYEWLGRALAAEGIETAIPVFPLDLAVMGADRAGPIAEKLGAGKRVILAGHSLGGAMAAQYAGQHPDKVAGLILLAAYPPDNTDLSQAPFAVLSVTAEHDGVLSRANWQAAQARLPEHTAVSLDGVVHAFFGRYGPQRGDGQPTVSRAQAEAQLLEAVRHWLAEPRP